MLEKLINNLIEHFYLPLYLVTWIVSVIRYRRYFDTPLKYLPMIIIYTFFTELLGVLIKYNNNFQFFSDDRYTWHNVIIYNIYQLVFFLFFFEVYRKVLIRRINKKMISYFNIVCSLAYIVNAFIYNPLHNQTTYAHIIGSLMLVFIVVQYLREKYAEGNLQPLKFNLLFWISIGLLVFYISFPFILITYMLKVDIWILAYFRPILLGSIALMYAFIIFGLLIGKRKAFR